MENLNIAYLSLGTNLGDREQNLKEALNALESVVSISQISDIYLTAPWGVTEQDDFLNICLEIYTTLDPHSLLNLCLAIEKQMGRVRDTKWGPRLIDIDILLFNEEIIDSETLSLPHPYMLKREFVMKPLCDIAPEVIHPLMKKSIQYLSSLVQEEGIIFYAKSETLKSNSSSLLNGTAF